MSGEYIEADYENSIIELFQNDLEYEHTYGPDIKRDFYSPLYEDVLIEYLYRLNRGLPGLQLVRFPERRPARRAL